MRQVVQYRRILDERKFSGAVGNKRRRNVFAALSCVALLALDGSSLSGIQNGEKHLRVDARKPNLQR